LGRPWAEPLEPLRQLRLGGSGSGRLSPAGAQSTPGPGRDRHPTGREAPHAVQPGEPADRDRSADRGDHDRGRAAAAAAGRRSAVEPALLPVLIVRAGGAARGVDTERWSVASVAWSRTA